ncbi:MAG: tetratricopeptide repeat protein [Acidimicrobiia bacterium]
MTTDHALGDRLAGAISLRQQGLDEEAREQLLELHRESPEDASVNLQCAWVHDKLGLEREAVPFYEAALRLGLTGDELHSALLGLGSTYRALGEHRKALSTLDRAVDEYPEDRGLGVFRAMALYNNGRAKEACESLLTILVDTTGDESITRYEGALREYAQDLDRTWG